MSPLTCWDQMATRVNCKSFSGKLISSHRKCFLVCPPLENMARKQCFLVCPPLVNMARKQCFLVCPPLVNMARKQCFLVCPPLGNMARETMFPGLSTFEKHG